MDSQQFAQVTSVFSLGGLIGSFFAGKLADLKRKKKKPSNIILFCPKRSFFRNTLKFPK